jgi:hypothetical protein
MYKFIFTFLLFGFIFSMKSEAAPAYAFRVTFKDKNGTLTFADSLQFLSPKALQRRNKQGIALDSTDLPIVQSYIDTVMSTAAAVKLHNKSKWFNQIVVITFDSSKITDILALPMVQSAVLVARFSNGIFKTETNLSIPKFPVVQDMGNKTRGTSAYYGLAYHSIEMLQGDCLHDLGYRGEGMDIAILDVNFRRTDSCAAFDTLLAQNRVKDVYNFARDTGYVYSMAIPSDHGMNALGCMAGNTPGTYVGTAPYANFHLYITEDITVEQPIEQDNWLSAAERADSIGIYVISSSLGYNIFDAGFTPFAYADMDGKTTLIAKAANKASSKGMFVAIAQGNEGGSAWQYLLTPADADSAYSVGSVDGSGSWANSGYGPNYAGWVKPNGVALGKNVPLIGGSCAVGVSNGSSFACPILCGAIACLWQSVPTLTCWQLKNLVQMVSSKYNDSTYWTTLGYGVPNLCLARQIALGTSDIQQVDYRFAIYPNPTQGAFDVKSFDPSVQKFTYSIYTTAGKLVYQNKEWNTQHFHSEALKNQAAGEYILLISTGTKMYTAKLMKL